MGSNLQLNSQIENYINNNSIDLHPVQKEIIKYNETLGEIKKMQISISQCHFLHLIVKIIKPKNILEIGTFTGLSALTMGLAMDENSKLTALDKNKETSDVAISFFKKAKIDNKINQNKIYFKNLLKKIAECSLDNLEENLENLYHVDAEFNGFHPINEIKGIEEIKNKYLIPLKKAFPDLERRNNLVIGGSFRDKVFVSFRKEKNF